MNISDDGSPLLSIILPALDEEESIVEVIESIPKDIGIPFEVIVVDNGSRDRTAALATERGCRVVIEKKRGYGNALMTGFHAARGELLLIADADGSYTLEDIPEILKVFQETTADMILGSRFKGRKGIIRGMTITSFIGNHIFRIITNLLYGTALTDIHTGFRLIKKSAIERMNLQGKGMEIASEMIIRARRMGLKVVEVPISFRERIGGVRKLKPFRDGFRHLMTIIYLLLR